MFSTPGSKKPAKSTSKIVLISPAFNGKSMWNLVADGPLDLTIPGTYTIFPLGSFRAQIEVGGACGEGGLAGLSAGNGRSGDTSSFNGTLFAFGGGGGRDSGSGSANGVGGGATGGDVNTSGSSGGFPGAGSSPGGFSGSGTAGGGGSGQGGSGGGYCKANAMQLRKAGSYVAAVGAGNTWGGSYPGKGHDGRIKITAL